MWLQSTDSVVWWFKSYLKISLPFVTHLFDTFSNKFIIDYGKFNSEIFTFKTHQDLICNSCYFFICEGLKFNSNSNGYNKVKWQFKTVFCYLARHVFCIMHEKVYFNLIIFLLQPYSSPLEEYLNVLVSVTGEAH